MDEQNKTKPEENQNKPVELSDRDLEQVAGGLTLLEKMQNENRSFKTTVEGETVHYIIDKK